MPQIRRYKAKGELKLDCNHTVKAGETFIATKTFSCEEDAGWLLKTWADNFKLELAKLEEKLKAA